MNNLYRQSRQSLKDAGIENPDLEARWILKHVLRVTDADLIAGAEMSVSRAEQETINSFIMRRASGEPLSRIFGEREFRGLNFKLNSATLDPRPDTEILVEVALKKFHVKQSVSILDLGTGSGAILIALLREMENARGVGIDISSEALKICLHNAKELGVKERCAWVCSDWGAALKDRQFDLIVSNPPYIASSTIENLESEVRNHDPILALDGGFDGLQAYKKIFPDIFRLLKKGGTALFEIGFDQEEKIRRLGEESRSRVEAVYADNAGRPRVVEISCGDK